MTHSFGMHLFTKLLLVGSSRARTAAPEHRLAILGMLRALGGKAPGPAAAALSRAIRREKDPDVRARAGAALSDLIARDVAADLAAGASAPRAPVAAR